MDFFEENIDAKTKISSLSMGSEKGIPTIAIHGWLDNALSFGKVGPLLNSLNIKALDMPGHGHSEHRCKDAQYNFIDWLPDIFEVADYLNFENFGLIGHSMGGGIASLVAGCIPDRVKFLVLIDGLGPQTSKPEELPQRVVNKFLAARKQQTRAQRSYESVEQAVATRMMAGKFVSEDSIVEMVERHLEKIAGKYFWTYDEKLKLPSIFRFSQEQVGAFLKNIKCPILIIRAKSGLPVVEKELAPMLSLIPHAEIVELEGYHHLHMDTPIPVAKIINEFIAKLKTPPSN